jgi:putative endonuclease
MATHNVLGNLGELSACTHLQNKGYQIREKNWRFDRAEIDIIAENADFLVIVEVKTRSTDFFGDPVFFVDKRKQGLMIKAAAAYLERMEGEKEVRFDIIGIVKDKTGEHLHHIEGAFNSWG